MAAGDRPADLVQAVAVPLPVLVICELLGVPASDRDRFRAWTRDAANVADRQRSMAGLGALFSYGQQLSPPNKTSRPTTSSRDWLPRLASAHSKPPSCRCSCSSPGMRPPWTKSARAPCSCSPPPRNGQP